MGSMRAAGLALLAILTASGVGVNCASAATPTPPDWLPHYDLAIRLEPAKHFVHVRQRVTWTNRHQTPTRELVFCFYPLYQIPDADYGLLAKTLEILRMPPSSGMYDGRPASVRRVTWGGLKRPAVVQAVAAAVPPPVEPLPVAGTELAHTTRSNDQTALVVSLPTAVRQDESVTVVLEFTIDLPPKQGRWGQWDGVSFLSNWLPMLAYYDDKGWQPTPFVAWHQPFFNEAGVFRANIVLPSDQKLACTAAVHSTKDAGDGFVQVETVEHVGRDFAVLCSNRYQEFTQQIEALPGKKVTLKCLAFPEHEFYAHEMLRIAGEAIAAYSRWFGPYPYPQFTISEACFGWNGNECSGLIMIDERVFDMPHIAVNYVEYLVSHETCHQWWYNLVGNNGYRETFLDEAPATFFAHKLLDNKLGKNNTLLQYPSGLDWLPNINRENYRYSSMMGTIGRHELKPAVGTLPSYGHVINMFSSVYDKGSKILGMIEERLGDVAFLDFMRLIQKKYAYRILTVVDLHKELEAYTGKPWGEFFDHWIYGQGVTDWSIERVTIRRSSFGDVDEADEPQTNFLFPPPAAGEGWGGGAARPAAAQITPHPNPPPPGGRVPERRNGAAEPASLPFLGGRHKGYHVRVILRQRAPITEQTVVGFSFDRDDCYLVRVLVIPHIPRMQMTDPPAVVEELPDGRVRVDVLLPRKPRQVAVDPDHVLVDSNPANNYWKPHCRLRFSPIYTLMDETDLTNDYDAWNLIFGPWVFGAPFGDPWYTRSTMAGVRFGAYRTQAFSGGIFTAYRTDLRDLAIGADGLWDHWPFPRTQVGFNFEKRIAGPFGTDAPSNVNRAVLFGRYVFMYGSSLYLPPAHYAEAFGDYQDNELPFARTFTPGAVRPDWRATGGLHYRLDYLTPYWDPEVGFRFDAVYAGGETELQDRTGYHELRSYFTAVKKLPWEGPGPLEDTRLAARVYGGAAMPGRGEYFALGGGNVFRGFDLAERQGSAFWVVNLEWRMMLWKNLCYDVADHVAGLRALTLAPFYDVGAIYVSGHSVDGVAHALGIGLRGDVSWFSFIERTELRLDVAKTVNAATPWQFWVGVQHAF